VCGQEPINYVRQIVARYRTYMDLIEQQKTDKNPRLRNIDRQTGIFYTDDFKKFPYTACAKEAKY